MDAPTEITALLDRKAYYVLMPILPGGLLAFCILAGQPGWQSVVLYSQGLGYIFRLSLLVGMAWVLGGFLFLLCFLLTQVAWGMLAAESEIRGTAPWKLALWQRTVRLTFGPDLIIEQQNEDDWRSLYEALESEFPDPEEQTSLILGALALSSVIAFCVGTIWWQAARLWPVYIGAVLAVVIAGWVVYLYGTATGDYLAYRQIGILLRHKLEVQKRDTPAPK